MTPFEYINSICYDKLELSDDPADYSDYSPWVINKGLSYNIDTVLAANQMNINSSLDKDMQYVFLKGVITKKKRYSKWAKKTEIADELNIICDKYNCSLQKAQEYYPLFSEKELENLKNLYNKGGRKNASERGA